MTRNFDKVIARPMGDLNAKASNVFATSTYATIAQVTPEPGLKFRLSFIGVSALDDVWCRILIGNVISSPERLVAGGMYKQMFFPYGICEFTGDGQTAIKLQIKTTSANTQVSGEIAGEEDTF